MTCYGGQLVDTSYCISATQQVQVVNKLYSRLEASFSEPPADAVLKQGVCSAFALSDCGYVEAATATLVNTNSVDNSGRRLFDVALSNRRAQHLERTSAVSEESVVASDALAKSLSAVSLLASVSGRRLSGNQSAAYHIDFTLVVPPDSSVAEVATQATQIAVAGSPVATVFKQVLQNQGALVIGDIRHAEPPAIKSSTVIVAPPPSTTTIIVAQQEPEPQPEAESEVEPEPQTTTTSAISTAQATTTREIPTAQTTNFPLPITTRNSGGKEVPSDTTQCVRNYCLTVEGGWAYACPLYASACRDCTECLEGNYPKLPLSTTTSTTTLSRQTFFLSDSGQNEDDDDDSKVGVVLAIVGGGIAGVALAAGGGMIVFLRGKRAEL